MFSRVLLGFQQGVRLSSFIRIFVSRILGSCADFGWVSFRGLGGIGG